MTDSNSLFKLVNSLFGDLILVNDITENNENKEVKQEEKQEVKKEEKPDMTDKITSELFNEDDLKDPQKRKEIIEGLTSIKDNYIFKTLLASNKYIDTLVNTIIDSLKKYDENEKKKIVRPSENIDPNIGVQLHKLVSKYIDEYVRPYYLNTEENQKLINNAYAGLYEFACWVIKQ